MTYHIYITLQLVLGGQTGAHPPLFKRVVFGGRAMRWLLHTKHVTAARSTPTAAKAVHVVAVAVVGVTKPKIDQCKQLLNFTKPNRKHLILKRRRYNSYRRAT